MSLLLKIVVHEKLQWLESSIHGDHHLTLQNKARAIYGKQRQLYQSINLKIHSNTSLLLMTAIGK